MQLGMIWLLHDGFTNRLTKVRHVQIFYLGRNIFDIFLISLFRKLPVKYYSRYYNTHRADYDVTLYTVTNRTKEKETIKSSYNVM